MENKIFDSMQGDQSQSARWLIFKPKIMNWATFEGSCNGRCWNNLWSFGLFTAIWYVFDLWPFGIFYILLFGIIFPVLESYTKKNLPTLHTEWANFILFGGCLLWAFF
jgi:hypothetical protein